jgi:hypothetical protein
MDALLPLLIFSVLFLGIGGISHAALVFPNASVATPIDIRIVFSGGRWSHLLFRHHRTGRTLRHLRAYRALCVLPALYFFAAVSRTPALDVKIQRIYHFPRPAGVPLSTSLGRQGQWPADGSGRAYLWLRPNSMPLPRYPWPRARITLC